MNRSEIDPQDEPDPVDSDPTLLAWLDFLARNMDAHPERLVPVTKALMERMLKAVEGIEVDLDEPIEGPVAL